MLSAIDGHFISAILGQSPSAQAVTEATSAVTETTSVAEETTAVIEATTAVFETTIATGETTEESTAATTHAVAETTTTSDTLITPEATTAPEPTSAPTTTFTLAGNEKKDPAPLDLGIMAAPISGAAAAAPIQILAIPTTDHYFSDPGYEAVLLQGSSTNGQAQPYILWVQGGKVLVAVKSNAEALSMSLSGTPYETSYALHVGELLSVDTHINLDPKSGLTGSIKDARWEIFAFPIGVLNTSGTYSLTALFQGGGWNINDVTFTVVVPTATANLTKTWVGGLMNPVSIQLYSKVGETGTPVPYGTTPITLTAVNGQATHTWSNLPLTNSQTEKLTYFIIEADPGQGYDVDFSSSYNASTETYTFTLFNIHTGPITATKLWNGGPKPPVEFQLYRKIGESGTPERVGDPVTLDGEVDENELLSWSYTWPYQRLSTNSGQPYTYFVRETTVPVNYAADTTDDLTVTNTYQLSTVTVSKFVAGNFGDRNRDFTFTATLPTGTNFPTPAVTSPYTVIANEATFTLKHGEDVDLIVPIGTVLTLEETNPSDYVVTVGQDSADPVFYETSGYELTLPAGPATTTLTFTNTKNILIDTGVKLDTLPYLLILLLLGAGGLGRILLKRKRTDFD